MINGAQASCAGTGSARADPLSVALFSAIQISDAEGGGLALFPFEGPGRLCNTPLPFDVELQELSCLSEAQLLVTLDPLQSSNPRTTLMNVLVLVKNDEVCEHGKHAFRQRQMGRTVAGIPTVDMELDRQPRKSQDPGVESREDQSGMCVRLPGGRSFRARTDLQDLNNVGSF
jgi:hypothetical protein